MKQTIDSKHSSPIPIRTPKPSIYIFSGIISGATQAGLLNPLDKALYLSVKNYRPFLHKQNFLSPYQGLYQTLFHRSLSGGLYFTLQSSINNFLTKKISNQGYLYHVLLGCSVGVLNGMILNQLSVIKYHMWGTEGNRSFIQISRDLYKSGGIRTYFNGMMATGIRDMVFGLSYELYRNLLKNQLYKRSDKIWINNKNTTDVVSFLCNFTSASLATILSSPFNYVRNIKYAALANQKSPSAQECLKQLWRESKEYGSKMGHSKIGTIRFLQQRLRIGWGSMRVGVGMGVGQWMFDKVTKVIIYIDESRF